MKRVWVGTALAVALTLLGLGANPGPLLSQEGVVKELQRRLSGS